MLSKYLGNHWGLPKSQPPSLGDLAGCLLACLLQSLASPAHLTTKSFVLAFSSLNQSTVKCDVEKVLICLCKWKACCLIMFFELYQVQIYGAMADQVLETKNTVQGLHPGTLIPQAFATSYSSSSTNGFIVSKRSRTGSCILTQFGQPSSF